MPSTSTPVTYTIAGAKDASGLGNTKIYELIGQEKLKAIKAGRRTLVVAESLHAYLASLPPAAIGRQYRKAA
jgi:excisionase family DNA binding protein